GIDIELVEQPVKAHDIKGMQYITKSVHTPILADESVFDAKQAIDIIQCGAADIINIKLMKCGGIYNALKIAAVAQIYSVECMMGCMLESHLAVSAAAHFAAGQSVVRYVDLDGPLLCKTNPFSGGPLFDTDRIIMQNTAGIGISEIPNCF
ncbi:MAG: enolase C-terminal domain-like protein, partial [Spirochaetales bacterium]